nr:caffeoyl-CoA O-methyltransferase-like [Tanacetum cinerariifolium]
MKELREVTAKHPWNLMTTSADEGQFLNMLLKLINAKNTMEIGVYTGYSLLSTALALPEDGKILALDINRENYEIGLPIIEKAGVAHKIDFREGPALPLLDQMVDDVTFHGSFDFIFVDADKDNYLNYHKRLIDLVKIGGVIGYDNTLWNGSLVAPPDAPMRKYVRYYRDFVLELNKALAVDPRVEICQLPVEVVPFDLVKEILVRLGVKDLLRCKSVCKLWQSLILSSHFVKSHLNHANNKDNSNNEIGHRRILKAEIPEMNSWQIVGSSNGLVCIIPTPVDAQVFYVANPSTRQVKELTTSGICYRNMDRKDLCWGFSYDSSIDDYKVVIGVGLVLGDLTVILVAYAMGHFTGLWKILLPIRGCLCIFSVDDLPNKTWVMKNYNVSSSWEVLLPCSYIRPMYGIAYKPTFNIQPNNIFYNKENICLSKTRDYMGAPIFVESLVSPHVNGRPKQVSGIEAPENMPSCINNCYNLESFWKTWHASFNKWLVRYMYIPLGGSRRKLLNVWVVFTFVAIWHDLEWKLLSWAWLTCIFFIPEMLVKSAATSVKVDNAFTQFIFRELGAVACAITITFVLRMISFGYDYHWSDYYSSVDQELDTPQKNYTLKQVAWYGIRWVLSLILMEIMTHFFYYNASAISGIWKQLSPMEVFIVGYGVRADGT